MSAPDLAPGFGCRGFVNTSTQATADWLAQCVLPQAALQTQTTREAVRDVPTNFQLVDVRTAANLQHYRFQQSVAGQPTCEGPVVLTFWQVAAS